jgi:SAM-dependent methyltransferase
MKKPLMEYSLDAESGVYIRPGNSGIGYEDGGESRLIGIATAIKDRATFSEELLSYMTDWPSEYHFSRKRHLVLRPFNIQPGEKVLELGAGCGSITRYLAEIGAEVTAVEGEHARAVIAAKRCEGYSNVRFIVDNFLSLDIPDEFDWVLMIGVLEYSQKYGTSENRQADYLDVAKRFLKSSGTLVAAIENKLGLKYFNGAGEDHNGQIFYGPQDLYCSNDVTTWGRQELVEILSESGFSHTHFFGAFPDYKLPKVIIDERIKSVPNFRAEELLHYVVSLDYTGKNQRLFDESMVLASLRKNGLMIDMANSFIVAAKLKEDAWGFDDRLLAHYFSVDRKKEQCTYTRFLCEDGKTIVVDKRSIDKKPGSSFNCIIVTTTNGEVIKITQETESLCTEYRNGSLLGFDFSKAVKRKKIEQVRKILGRWLIFLVQNFPFYNRDSGETIEVSSLRGRNMQSVLIEGAALDCGPQNIITGEADYAFDLEWQADRPIPLAWVLNRSAIHINRHRHSADQLVSATEIVSFVSEMLGLALSTMDFQEAAHLEKQFQSGVAHVEPSGSMPLTNGLFGQLSVENATAR